MIQGEVILLKYKILRILKDAQDACIFLVEHIDLNSYWIIKKVHRVSDKHLKEVALLKGIKHDNIPLLVDVIIEGDFLYLIREYIDGLTLDQYIREKGRITEMEGVQIGIDLCKIVEFFHDFPQPIIIRDIKPNNMIIARDGAVKLIDFSIAKHFESSSVRDTEYLGTRGFAAMEQYGTRTHDKCDKQTDVFGIGATLYYLFTQQDLGKPPYNFESFEHYRADLSDSLEKILKKACQLKKEDRFPSVSDMRGALCALVQDKKSLSLMDVLREMNVPIILVQGIKSGCGVTHHCLGLSEYFKQQRLTTCLVDFSQNQDLERLEYQEQATSLDGIIELEGVSIISNSTNTSEKLDSFRRQYKKELWLKSQREALKKADIIILDGGMYRSDNPQTIQLISLNPLQRIIISGANPWEIELLEECIINECHQAIDYAINFGTQHQVNQLQQSIDDKKFTYLPFIPFEIRHKEKHNYDNLVGLSVKDAIHIDGKEETRWFNLKSTFFGTKRSKILSHGNTKQ
jgi:serine/threonine protein kinase